MSVRNYEEYRRQVLDSLGEDYTVEDLRNFERWRLKVLEGLQAISSDPEAIKEAVEDWLDEHPEATTTVADGSITKAKLFADLIAEIDGKADETDLNDLKSDLDENIENINRIDSDYYDIESEVVTDEETPTWESGVLNPNGSVTANSTYQHSDSIQVEEGDIIKVRGLDTAYGIVTTADVEKVCAYLNGSAVESKGASSSASSYTVPSGVDSIKVTILSRYTNVIVYVSRDSKTYTPRLGKVLEISEKSIVKRVAPTIVEGKTVSKSGVISNNSSYYYFELDVKEGDVIKGIRTYYDNSTSIVRGEMRTVCAYKGNIAVSSLGADSVNEYTVPTDVTKVAITMVATYQLADYVDIYRMTDVESIKTNDIIDSFAFGSYPQTVSGNISASGRLSFKANAVKKNKAIIFKGDITTFNQITIGQGGSDLNSGKIVIDDTNLTLYRGTSQNGDSNAHGLTFKTYLFVMVDVDNAHIPTVTIMTDGGMYRHTFVSTWIGCVPTIYAEADGNTALTDCELSFVCKDIDEPLWIFGDSGVSFTDDRWIYYIHQLGFDNYLLNGYSGETSAYGAKDLDNLLQYGTPKYILWCLGGNDKDGNSSANSMWKSVYDELIGICNKKGITLVLVTLPNSSELKNTFKNGIVVNSGYKYINLAKAVGAFDDSTWYDGMLSSDNVHPTIEGAKALASQVLKDFPYICIK